MSMLELHSPYHGRNPVERSERGGPIRNRKSSLIAGDQRTSDKQEKSDAGCENKKIVERTIELSSGRLQNKLLKAASSPWQEIAKLPKNSSL